MGGQGTNLARHGLPIIVEQQLLLRPILLLHINPLAIRIVQDDFNLGALSEAEKAL